MDLILSAMENLPLSIGGGGSGAGPSQRPLIDLNLSPAPEPEPALPSELSEEEKEVIQPHLPVRLPCYDFTPVTSPAFGIPLLVVKVTTSGMASSHSVTGGVYKARERIHRRMADRRLLAIPASCRRVAAYNPN
jgi:hypothetical protein